MKSLMTKSLVSVEEASALIRSGSKLLLAGDENRLASLPTGCWLGGTIPYFMTEDGGEFSRDKIQVIALPDCVSDARVVLYDAGELARIPRDYRPNGFSYIVIPAFSAAHQEFAKHSSTWPGVFDRPLVGWISGIDLAELGRAVPKIVDGTTGEISSTKAAVLHVNLPPGMFATANTINLFRQGGGDTITFPEVGFQVRDCCINGERRSFADYVTARKIDTRQPLVADYMGAMINVSFQSVDPDAGTVSFYAPVFPGVEYKLADPVLDYEGEFRHELNGRRIDPVFSCNCILNYLYAHLEGRKTGHMIGPITFGEIAYALLNQTLVYLSILTK